MRLMFYILLLMAIIFTACRRSDEITTDKKVKLSFSTDTVFFDTVFTAVGSTNKRVKVYNKDQKAVSISNIRLSGGSSSYFSLIINGQPLNEKNNLQIDGKDSVSIFVKVSIDPDNQLQPFIVQDSIIFNTNGNRQTIPLIAYGQNAVFINNEQISNNTTWTSTLPYIIYKSVAIAPNATLNIMPGTRVLFHSDASMVVKGRLNVEGTKLNPVLFSGDRQESYYAEEPGQWNGIHFLSSSSGSVLHYAVIKNAIVGIRADSLGNAGMPKVIVSSSIVRNMTIAGFMGYQTSARVFNSLFFNCGQYLIYGIGGEYDVKQNTFAGYNPRFARRTPAVYFSDFSSAALGGDLKIDMANNVIWGPQTEEFLIEKKTSAAVLADVRYNLIKTLLQTYNGNGNILNTEPGFVNTAADDFRLQNNSLALNKGADLSTNYYYNSYLRQSLNYVLRSATPDLGCYEQ